MKLVRRLAITIMLCAITVLSGAQNANQKLDYRKLSWKQLAGGMPEEWYGTTEAKTVADSVLKYQTRIGGWAKNQNYHLGVNQQEWQKIKESGIGATFDNGATITETKFLMKMYRATKDLRYKKAFNRAFDYMLLAQYDNGGWPQFYPLRKGKSIAYNAHITYNDNAMVNVMTFLKGVANGDVFYADMNIGPAMKAKAKTAFDKGISCILKTQIVINGKPTVWCAQHDEVTFAPANARAYELASFSGAESAGIVMLLMDIDKPSAEIIHAIKGAKFWFEEHKLQGIRLQHFVNNEGAQDLRVVHDKDAPALWARFYDLETGEPYFCDRDGIKRKTFAEMGYNRRNGYSWYNSTPAKVLNQYPAWAAKHKI